MSGIEGDATLSAADRSGAPPARVDDVATDQIGRYTLRERIGAGGMGIVYAARDRELQRDVALKLVRPRGDVTRTQARLQREAQAMARLSHRNVVPVFDLGTHDGQLYVAMELVIGETLRTWVGKRPWRDVVELFARAGRGLAAAHAAGVIHRDFKPDNVIVGPDDEPRITDFGLARELAGGPDSGEMKPGTEGSREAITAPDGLGEEGVTAGASSESALGIGSAMRASTPDRLATVTVAGNLAGTPAYMAPEQLRGEAAGAAADQFSFCVTLFEVLYGARPFAPAGPSVAERLAEIRAGRIAAPPRRAPRWLHAAIVRGLAFAPERRWPSLAALVDALERGQHRQRWLVVVPVIAAAAAGALWLQRPEPPPGCLAAVEAREDTVTLVACKDEFLRGRDPRVGVAYAQVLLRTGQPGPARAIAEQLVASVAGGDALYTLGRITADEGRPDDALRLFQLAATRHRADGSWGLAAGDLVARVAASDDVVGQLVDLDAAIVDAKRGADLVMQGYAHLSAARLLARIGARAAWREVDRATPLMTRGRDAIQLAVTRGNVAKDLGEYDRAAEELARARVAAASNAQMALTAQLNATYVLVEAGRLAEATAALAEAQTLDPGDRMPSPRRWLAAHLAIRTGDLAQAAAWLDEASARLGPDDADLAIVIEDERAELAIARGDHAAAAAAARRAILQREAPMRTIRLRSWLVTEQRTSYELLFASLALAGDARGALLAFDRIQGLDVLVDRVRGAATEQPEAPGIAFAVAALARAVQAAEHHPLATSPSEQATLAAVAHHAMLALVIARGELWRITAVAGQLEISRLGAPPLLAAASELPAALAASRAPLYVVLDPRVDPMAVAALRVDGHPLSASRTIVRSSRVAAIGCAAPGTQPAPDWPICAPSSKESP